MEGIASGGEGLEGIASGGEGVEGIASGGEGVEGIASGGEGKDCKEAIVLTCDEVLTEVSEEMWVSELSLYHHDHEVLSSNTAWVNDNIVHSAQLLQKELSKDEIKGWQSPQLCKTKALFSPLPPYSPFVVLHVSQNHWITVSNMMQGGKISHDSVFVYDSLLPNVTKMDTKKQICSFLRPQSKTVLFELMNIQMQESLNDCGLHAIAIATELVYERDPCKHIFWPRK